MNRQDSTQNCPFYWRLVGVLVIASVGLLPKLQAHPHIWVDLQITANFNEQQALTGLTQRWQFDPFYSLVLAEDLQHADPQRRAQLKSDIWQNLEPMDFYTELTVAGNPQIMSPKGEFKFEMDGFNVVLSFELTLTEPLSPELLGAADIRYRIFEPTYYIDMMHVDGHGLVFPDEVNHCKHEIIAARPNAEARQRAIDVDDLTASEDVTLGQYFAQTVVIQCIN